jgi:hypothetical protein
MKKETGIWLDSNQAFIISLSDNQETIQKIESKLEHYHVHGGSGSSTPYAPQDAVSDTKLMRRKEQQLNAYFEKIITHLNGASSIAVFGPAETKISFSKLLDQRYPYKNKVVATKTVDNMTKNQMIAMVKKFYHQNNQE